MMDGKFDEVLSHFISAEEVADYLAGYISEGKWKEVIDTYKKYPVAHTAMINDYESTALHVAIDMDEEGVVQELVNAVIAPPPPPEITMDLPRQRSVKKVLALESENMLGDTPLHVAASRGIVEMCEWIIGKNKERIYLLSRKNKHGETPLFQAAINGRKLAFAYLSHISAHSAPWQDLVRNNGDTILHCAIRIEYFDLAVIILHYYDALSTFKNKGGEYPIKVLANRPSAFRSSTYLSLWKRLLYHCIHVEQLDAKSAMEEILLKTKNHPNSDRVNYPKNYSVLLAAFTAIWDTAAVILAPFAALCVKIRSKNIQHDTENPSINKQKIAFGTRQVGLLPPNYKTIHQFVKSAPELIMGLLGQDIIEVKKTKERHQWGGQLFKALMKRPDAAFTGSGGVPTDMEIHPDIYKVYSQWKEGETSELRWLEKGDEEEKKEETKADDNKKPSSPSDTIWEKNYLQADEKNIDKKETPFLAAARNGIVEMVIEILSQNPIVIRETNSQGDNVLLVAVRNRKPLVVESLQMKLLSKPEVWNTLTLAVDKDGKTMLHLAADGPPGDKPWQISGSALQMMWDVNWFQYIKSLVPQHYYFRRDREQNIPREIFKEKHKDLRKESGKWMRETSESCSVVAALVAGASFATAATIPGGTDENGMPHLEDKPTFEAFVIASLIGLCFSVTGLIMFLTILTSRKLHRDFRRDLPLKLLLGLSSLFVSIVALLVSFCTGHSFLFGHKYKMLILPIYVATCLPVTFYAIAQLPLYFDLLAAILVKVPQTSDEGDSL